MVALVTLALGIGANVVVFGVLNAVLLRPLDVSDPQSLYQIRHKPWMTGRLLTTSVPAFEDYERRNTAFRGMAAINAYSHAALRWRNMAINVNGDEVTGNYFDLLGVRPALGRFFHRAEEHGPNSVPYLVLSDQLWRSAFAADPGIVGATVELNDHPFTVLGVAPAQFHGTERFAWPDYWVPMMNEEQVSGADYLRDRSLVAVTVIGRLRSGVTLRQATENLTAISAELAREYPETDDGLPLRLVHPGLFGDEGEVIRGFLYGVSFLALLVLAAACANLATLCAARAADRSRELALRVALGSSRRRLFRQLLTEAVTLAVMGGAAGLMGADLLLGVLNRWQPAAEAHLAAIVDGRVYLAGLAFTLGSALLFGTVPAWRAWRSTPLQAMKSVPFESMHAGRFSARDLLLGVEIAICTLLVTSSLVAVRSMVRALDSPLGVHPQGVMLAEIDLSQTGRPKEMIDAVRSIPGVTAVATVNLTPMTGGLHGVPVYRPGTTEFRMTNYADAPYVFSMSPGFFDAAGTRLLSGRDVSWRDTAKTPHVAIVNATFARQMWGATPAIGQHFLLWRNLTEVVGMVEDGKYHDLTESPHGVVFVPFSQSEQGANILVVRSRRPSNEMAAELQRTFRTLEPNVPFSMRRWTDDLDSQLLPARAAASALSAMGALAALLAVTGIFGMSAYSVSRRMKEFGIRAALGARTGQLMHAAVGRPVVLLGVGSLIGLLAGLAASRLLGQIVYQANPRDPVVLGGAVLTMALLGLAATAIPVRRALGADPARLMREE